MTYGPKRGPKFRPSLYQQQQSTRRALEFMSPDDTLPPELERLDWKKPPVKRVAKIATESVRDESDVQREVAAVLRAHPRVILAWRQNSGSSVRTIANGETVPVNFWYWMKHPPFADKYEDGLLLPDILGIVAGADGIASCAWLAIETKAPDWRKPTSKRERHQAAFLEIVRRNGGIGLFATSGQAVSDALG